MWVSAPRIPQIVVGRQETGPYPTASLRRSGRRGGPGRPALTEATPPFPGGGAGTARPRETPLGQWKSIRGPCEAGSAAIALASQSRANSKSQAFHRVNPGSPTLGSVLCPFSCQLPSNDALGRRGSVFLSFPAPCSGPDEHPPRALSGRRLANLRSLGMVRM